MKRRASCFLLLAALLLWGCLPALALRPSPLETRVGGCDQFASGQDIGAGSQSLGNATGFGGCGCESASGRHGWLNQDPIGERGGINLYRFAGNNPVNKVDPFGLQVPPQVIEVLESPEAQELEEVIEADAEAAAEATEAEAESIWSKTVDYFSKAKQTTLNKGLGQSAENATCPLKNTTRIPSLNGTAKYRVPDLLDKLNNIIGDTKNVQYQAMTPQLQDFVDWAAANGYTFQLTVSTSTTLSSSVINAVPNIVRAPLP